MSKCCPVTNATQRFFFNICGSMNHRSILLNNQLDAALSHRLYYSLRNYSTCFGCCLHPSSGVHKGSFTFYILKIYFGFCNLKKKIVPYVRFVPKTFLLHTFCSYIFVCILVIHISLLRVPRNRSFPFSLNAGQKGQESIRVESRNLVTFSRVHFCLILLFTFKYFY
jgi:hypothetical protein